MNSDKVKRSVSAVERKSKTNFKKGRKAMKTKLLILTVLLTTVCLLSFSSSEAATSSGQPYDCEEDLIEVMFAQDSRVRLRNGTLLDLATSALAGVDGVVQRLAWFEWNRICDVPEERLDEIQSRGEANTGKPVYNLNNIYRLRIPKGLDVWAISQELEALPGIILARPVPKPMPLPSPPNYASCTGDTCQGYLRSASSTPTGIDADYAWTQTGGNGTGVTVCDLEYGWNYNHADLTKAVGSQINPNPIFYPAGADTNHGTAVIGELVSDNNAWGTTGICYGATLKTCGTVYPNATTWNVPGAIAYAIDSLSAGDVILLEQQWAYTYLGTDYIPIEWWLNYSPNPQSYNGVYAAIENAVANGINVVEAGGNGYVNTDHLTWHGNSGAIIVGAGGVYTGGTWPQGDLQKLNFSSFGRRFDLQGWGENVTTTGYGDLYSAQGYNYWYRKNFDGTSSASPIVAGAVACCVGYWKANISANPPSPHYLRTVLINTGTPQVGPQSGWIGPRPDLRDAIVAFGAEWVDLTYSPLGEDTTYSLGVAWGDYDNDGDLDVYLAHGGNPNELFGNEGGGVFVDATSGPLGDSDFGEGVAWGDYDNDGDLDLYLANCGTANKLFRNGGGGVFVDATTGPLGDPACGSGVAWGDFDNDGDLDLYLVNSDNTNKLFRNDGSGTFVDATSGPLGDSGTGVAVACADYDNDGDLDIYIVNAGNANRLLRNEGNLVFVDATSGPLGDALNGRGVDWGDYDNDGDLDLYFANRYTGNKLLRNDGGGVFVDVTSGPLADGGHAKNIAWGDYDNDGDLDLFLAKGDGATLGPNRLLRNDGGGTFVDATSGALVDLGLWSGASLGDFDNDGDLDLYVANMQGPNRLFLNQKGSTKHWLHVSLVGVVSNKSAIGARVRAHSGTLSQIREISGGSGYMSQNSLTVEFGIGYLTSVDSLIIRWPSGTVQKLTSLPVDTLLTITESALIRGDANGDGVVNIGDVVFLVAYLYKNGPAPNPLWVGDANSDGIVNIGDVVYLVSYLYKGGPPPCSPGRGREILASVSRLNGNTGRARVSLEFKTDPGHDNPPGLAKVAPGNFDEVVEISVTAEFDRMVAGVELEVEFDLNQMTMLDPVLTSLTDGLQLFAGVKDGTQRIGMVDLSGKNFLAPGEGTLITLRARGSDLSSIEIKKATLVDLDARPLAIELSEELELETAKGSESRPQRFSLSQNYPNPFNPRTSIRFALPQDAHVSLTVYNVLGQKVVTLVDEEQPAGYETVWWDGKDATGDEVSSGIYFYRLEADEFLEVKKMLLVK
ncbi:MAG: FG-GAP-like repeat-containing protein [Candidatus Zixiibacteriota bacterium]